MYCRKCRRTYEPDVPSAFPGMRLSLRTMLVTGYLKTEGLVDNFLKRKKELLFRFVIDLEVEPTNNRTERALRPSVV
ncbi:MAG: transposase [Thermoplasmatales archaeon]